jgi:hypothetical protein
MGFFSPEDFLKKIMKESNCGPNRCESCSFTYTKGVSFGQGEAPISMRHCQYLDFLTEPSNYTKEFLFLHYDDTKGHYFECPVYTDSSLYTRLRRVEEVRDGKDFSLEGDIPLAGMITVDNLESFLNGGNSSHGKKRYPNAHIMSKEYGTEKTEVDELYEKIMNKIYNDDKDDGLGF